jgi:toluene monooxygenase system ferredoxin subunit
VFERVCTTDDVWVGELIAFDVASRKIILINVEDKFHAYDAQCPHQDQSLCEGSLEGTVLTCPAHQWQFDVTTGLGVNPTGCKLKAYALKIEADEIYVDAEQTPEKPKQHEPSHEHHQ